MKIALAQINTTIGDFKGNSELILEYSRRAGQRNADLVVFPELTLTGYPPKDLLDRPDFIQANLKTLRALQKQIQGPACVVGFVDVRKVKTGRRLANAAALIHQGKILHTVHKRLLPSYDVFDEGRYFEAGKGLPPTVTFKGRKLGISICEDMWSDESFWGRRFYTQNPIQDQMEAGADILINISASPYSMGKGEVRRDILTRPARQYGVPVVYVNLVGGNDDLIFDGTSLVIDSKGREVLRLPSFREDLEVINLNRTRPKSYPKIKQEAQVLDGLIMGLRDYMRKCGFKKAVVGLSGGVDSSLTAWIAAAAIGPKNIVGISMPSPYSSKGSLRDAETLARSLGMEYRVYPIGDLYGEFKKVLGYQKEKKVDVTLQNIQARIRGILLMALSNRENRILLSTGNKSEMSIGYSTLYGDMAGGFSVLLDVPKTLVYRLARLANSRKKAIPLSTLRKPPSAELAPNQRDQDDLPPYEVLDDILRAYMEEGQEPKEILKRGHSKNLVEQVLQRLDNNEYKRMQAPPGIRITSKAFGYGRRVPITSRYRVKW